MTTDTDRIQKRILLRAPRERVWRAVSDSKEFGSWFGVDFDGAFAPGARVKGRIVPTKVDPEVAKMQEPYTGMAFDFTVDRIEPMRVFSFRWHPFAIDPGVESGFDRIPLERRAKAFAANEQGWEHQTKLIEKYLS